VSARKVPAAGKRRSGYVERGGADDLVSVDVTPGYLVAVDGVQQGGTVQVPRDLAEQWTRRGWVRPTG
jgi:hypothetical protein